MQKRNVFVSIQNAHTIACEGNRQPYVQTGYETIAAQRVDNLFCFTAEEDGKVISLNDKGILVEYKSGLQRGVNLGRQYGNAEGATYPHDILPLLKEGEKFTKGDVIAYNSGFWEPDFLDPKKVVMKMGMMVWTAFEESATTHEDSCAISTELAKRMEAKTTKVKSYTVQFGQNLHEVLKPGTEVNPDSILMSIEDEITAGTGMFDVESAALLGKLSRNNPRASYSGGIDKIEVFYHGEKSDMSPSIKALADRSDKNFVDSSKAAGKPVVNGRVSGDYRVAGKNLQPDHAEIKFYITVSNSMGIADKLVVANQLKSTVGKTMNYSMTTESGRKLDGVFGGRSAIKRIVNSYAIEGSTTGILMFMDEKSIELYES